jgi:hypothetical protein
MRGASTDLYLDLMKTALLGSIYPELDCIVWPGSYPLRWLLHKIFPSNVRFFRQVSPVERGLTWPSHAYTMIGPKRLDNIRFCIEDVIKHGVPGDFIETGVWRGGASIFARAVLKSHEVTDRIVWVADSFEGLPKPDAAKYPADAGDRHFLIPELAISFEQVQANFRAFNLLDNQVQFLKGWFKNTLPKAPIKKLAVARLDGDLYESTMDALTNLYPKLSAGGYLIVDDYNAVPACKKAIHDYRDAHGIKDLLQEIDLAGVFWKKT